MFRAFFVQRTIFPIGALEDPFLLSVWSSLGDYCRPQPNPPKTTTCDGDHSATWLPYLG
jgi:hypothetical protein